MHKTPIRTDVAYRTKFMQFPGADYSVPFIRGIHRGYSRYGTGKNDPFVIFDNNVFRFTLSSGQTGCTSYPRELFALTFRENIRRIVLTKTLVFSSEHTFSPGFQSFVHATDTFIP